MESEGYGVDYEESEDYNNFGQIAPSSGIENSRNHEDDLDGGYGIDYEEDSVSDVTIQNNVSNTFERTETKNVTHSHKNDTFSDSEDDLDSGYEIDYEEKEFKREKNITDSINSDDESGYNVDFHETPIILNSNDSINNDSENGYDIDDSEIISVLNSAAIKTKIEDSESDEDDNGYGIDYDEDIIPNTISNNKNNNNEMDSSEIQKNNDKQENDITDDDGGYGIDFNEPQISIISSREIDNCDDGGYGVDDNEISLNNNKNLQEENKNKRKKNKKKKQNEVRKSKKLRKTNNKLLQVKSPLRSFTVIKSPPLHHQSEQKNQKEEQKNKKSKILNIQDFVVKDWNKEFQSILSTEESLEKYTSLQKLGHDFVYAAKTYGKIIISEVHLDPQKKTIKPSSIGGIAGGAKYFCQSIFFKLVTDTFIPQSNIWMYGGPKANDSAAIKAAGLDLKGLISLFNVSTYEKNEIHFPLMALIDYRGYRLIAISILPVSKDTLIYGSADGGETVKTSDEKFNCFMDKLGSELNLKKHIVADKQIALCGDIEGHFGTDEKHYLLDFARVFPPEAPPKP